LRKTEGKNVLKANIESVIYVGEKTIEEVINDVSKNIIRS
jgi:hypothetical protein